MQIGGRQNLHTAVTQHSTTLRVEAIATRERTVNLAAWVSKHPEPAVYWGKSAVMLRSVVRSLLEARVHWRSRAMEGQQEVVSFAFIEYGVPAGHPHREVPSTLIF